MRVKTVLQSIILLIDLQLMVIRIVKLEFKPQLVESFLLDFEENKNQIRKFDGCEKLNLLQDKNASNIFFTYSYWKSENHLNNYRDSTLFKTIWKKTKIKFLNHAEAWTLTNTNLID